MGMVIDMGFVSIKDCICYGVNLFLRSKGRRGSGTIVVKIKDRDNPTDRIHGVDSPYCRQEDPDRIK